MYKRFEGQLKSFDGTELFTQKWEHPSARGDLLIVHGFAEHSDPYLPLVEFLYPLAMNCWAVDLRGHGRSAGRRGYVKDYSDYIGDYRAFLAEIKRQTKGTNRPLVNFSHSNGGLIVLRSLIDHGSEGIDQFCLSSPFLGFAIQVPGYKDFASRLLNRWAPKVTLGNEIRLEDLSRDPAMVEISKKDFYRHDKISAPTFLGMTENMAYVHAHAPNIQEPLFVQIAGEDKIADAKATRNFFGKLPSLQKKLIIYKDSYHELVNDSNREEVMMDLLGFLKGKFPL